MIEAARTWWDIGALPLPVATDGTKRPAVHTWRELQDPANRPSPERLQQLHGMDSDGIGIICGRASAGIEMLELEGRAVAEGTLPRLEQAFADHDRTQLWARIRSGYAEITPSGGIHWYYRVDGPALGNTKLAMRPSNAEELEAHKQAERAKLPTITDEQLRSRRAEKIENLTPRDVPQVLIETRGEGGWSVVAPSAGRSHRSGKPWIAMIGTPARIPTISADERDLIHDMCRLLDTMPEPTPPPPGPCAHTNHAPVAPAPAIPPEDLRPGDDFNARAKWEDILIPHGWSIDHRVGRTTYWIRPGKRRGEGVSATTGHSDDDHDRLYVFSTSTEFDSEVPYSKLGAYAVLEHGGDHAAAASALRAMGYGSQESPRLRLLPPNNTPATNDAASSTAAVDGSMALQPAPVAHLNAPVAIEDTEDALAQAFVAEVARTVRYCPQRNQWLTWNGSRWSWDEAEAHREYIKSIARRLPTDSKPATAFRRKMLSSAGVAAVARLSRSDPAVVVHLDDLDARPWELNTPGGIVDLRTGTLSTPNPDNLHTRSTAVAPDFDATPGTWLQFLQTTFNADQEMIGYIQRLMGVAAIGQALEQSLPFAHGVGANGKSVFFETCSGVLGRGERGYSIAANAEMLMVRKYAEHPTELAQLAGARMVLCSELEDGARFAEARIKQLTGSDSISARFMARDFFTFTPSHTIFLVANHKPQAAVGGAAFWRRIRLLPFLHVVPEEQRDPHLPDKLRGEWPAILAWIIRGAASYARGGIQTPEGVLSATSSYEHAEDSLGRFVAEACHLAPGSNLVQIRTMKLREAYEQMCRELGDEPVSARRFTEELRDRFGVSSIRSNGKRFSAGITLLQSDQDEPTGPDDEALL